VFPSFPDLKRKAGWVDVVGARAEGFESAGTWKQPRPGWAVARSHSLLALSIPETLDETACLGVGTIPTQKVRVVVWGCAVDVGVAVSCYCWHIWRESQGFLFLGPLCDSFHQHPTSKRRASRPERCDGESPHRRGPGLLLEWHPSPLTTDWKDPFILDHRRYGMLINARGAHGAANTFSGAKT
jgi:hypothetical protein